MKAAGLSSARLKMSRAAAQGLTKTVRAAAHSSLGENCFLPCVTASSQQFIRSAVLSFHPCFQEIPSISQSTCLHGADKARDLLDHILCACRQHGGGVPEFWGKDSPYHPGTDFLGTPKDHLDVSLFQDRIAAHVCICVWRTQFLRLSSASIHFTSCTYLQRVKGRPVSPHVFEEGGTQFHYKMPINAVTSIMNRVTGVALTVGAQSPVSTSCCQSTGVNPCHVPGRDHC